MSFLSRCCSSCIAFCIRHSVTYSNGVCLISDNLRRVCAVPSFLDWIESTRSSADRLLTGKAFFSSKHASYFGKGAIRSGCRPTFQLNQERLMSAVDTQNQYAKQDPTKQYPRPKF